MLVLCDRSFSTQQMDEIDEAHGRVADMNKRYQELSWTDISIELCYDQGLFQDSGELKLLYQINHPGGVELRESFTAACDRIRHLKGVE